MNLAMEAYIPRIYLGEDEGFRLIKETGFDCVDYSFYWMQPDNTVLGDDYLFHANRVKALLDKYNLTCNQTHAPFTFSYGNPLDLTDSMYLSIVRSMEFSAILGAKHVVVHGVKVPDGIDLLSYNLSFYRSLEPYCKKYGIRVAIENLFSSLKTIEVHNALLDALDPECFVALVDVGHAILCGYTAQEYIRGIREGRLEGLHIHDNFGQADDHMIPGIGVIQWDEVISALADVKYSGDFTLESWRFMAAYGPDMLKETIRMNYSAGRYFCNKLEKKLENAI